MNIFNKENFLITQKLENQTKLKKKHLWLLIFFFSAYIDYKTILFFSKKDKLIDIKLSFFFFSLERRYWKRDEKKEKNYFTATCITRSWVYYNNNYWLVDLEVTAWSIAWIGPWKRRPPCLNYPTMFISIYKNSYGYFLKYFLY
jgi:hypothetical protein